MTLKAAPTAVGTLRSMQHDIGETLIDRHAIARRVGELAELIRRDLEELDEDVEIILVPILTGSIIFLADLIRHLPQKIRIHVVTASSYTGKRTQTTGDPIVGSLPDDLAHRHVLIVDDILDSGTTSAPRSSSAAPSRSAAACFCARKGPRR